MTALRDLYWLTSETNITRIENDANGLALYIGLAAAGAGESEERWQIKKLTYVNNAVTEINFAQGSPAYKSSWTNRATYTYS